MIGTNEIKFERIRNGNLILSNKTKQQIEQKKKSFLLEVFKILGITVIATAAAALGQYYASAGLIYLGVSEIALQTTTAFVGASIEFGIMQTYDIMNNSVSKVSTALNALPFLSIISKAKRANKIQKLLELTQDNNLLKELNYSSQNIKNLNQVLNIFNKKPIKIGNDVFDFSKSETSRYDVLKFLGSLTKHKFINETLNIFKTKNYNLTEIEYLFDMQKILVSINPNLLPKVDKKFFEQAKTLFRDFKITPNDLLDEKKFNKLIFNTRTLKGNKSANLIWSLSAMRNTKIIENKLTKKIFNTWSKINQFASKVNPLAYISKVISATLNKITKKLREKIIKPILNPIKNKFSKIIEKINSNLKGIKFISKSKQKIESKLIAINSQWLLGYKFQKNIDNSFYVAIYFQSPNEEPRFFNMSYSEFNMWVDSCNLSRAGEYYKANLELGYHLKFSEIGYVLNFLPIAFIGFLKLSIDTYNQYKKFRGYIENIKKLKTTDSINKIKSVAENNLKQTLVSLFFASALTKTFALSFLNKRSQLKLLNNKSKQYANKYLTNKVRKIRRI